MTTGHIGVKEAGTPDKYMASRSITEDAKTKEIQRVELNDASGVAVTPLTDAELRATPVPVSGTVTANLSATDNAVLDDILDKLSADPATQTTLAALLAKVIVAPATEAKQDTLIAKDFATQTTLAAVLAKIIAAPATEAKQDTIVTSLGSDVTTPSPAMPAGGAGVKGWLSAIWTKLNASLAVTGTFWQATQPVSATDLDIRDLTSTDVVTAELSATDNAVLDAIAAVEGTTSGAAVITDANGTIQQYLRGLIKLFITSGSALVTAIVGGDVAHDGVDSGNPIKIGGKAASANPTAVAAGDRVNWLSDLIGRFVIAHNTLNENISISITAAMTGTTSTLVLAAPGAGLRWYIDGYALANSHATIGTSCNLQDGSGGTAFWSIPGAAAFGGANVSFAVPIPQPTANTALYCVNTVTGASTILSVIAHKGI